MNCKDLLYTQKNGWEGLPAEKSVEIHDFAEGYKAFLDSSMTEREAVATAVKLLSEAGFRPFSAGQSFAPGDKVYMINRDRALAAAVIGTEPFLQGFSIAAAHVDAPRIDLKPNPLFENKELCYFKTHYYGGVKKYQWTAIPLALSGVVVLSDGQKAEVSSRLLEGAPVFTITDLLPHLAKDQMAKKAGEIIHGESMNVLIGSVPYADEGSDKVKLAVLSILNEQYGLCERDFVSAELSLVPAFSASDVGFDRSMVGAYGQDDRACSYTALQALLAAEKPQKTAVCFLSDKEEIGSEGVAGLQSQFFDTFLHNLCEAQGARLDLALQNSSCLSCDVCNAFDPNYPEVSDERNNGRLNYGLAVMKYTGSRGKSGASDATAEFTAKVCALLDKASVLWQVATLGKVDQGGGGTVAAYLANRNIDTIDAGVPVLSMHAPFEVTSKLDIYMSYQGIRAYFEA